MAYRTRTYIAGDWDNDLDIVEQLRKWNESPYWKLDFVDAHDFKRARDDSLYCSIKRSLQDRMDRSKAFVLIVGDHTKSTKKGNCSYCPQYSIYRCECLRGNSESHKSYIDYECEKAVRDELEVLVIYKSTRVDREKCPDAVRWKGEHIAAYKYENGKVGYNYQEISMEMMLL